MKSYFYFFKLFEKSLKRGTELPFSGERTEKEVFYLNDFYDLLYEKENTMTHIGRLKELCCTACWISHTNLELHCLDCLCFLGTCGWQCYDC